MKSWNPADRNRRYATGAVLVVYRGLKAAATIISRSATFSKGELRAIQAGLFHLDMRLLGRLKAELRTFEFRLQAVLTAGDRSDEIALALQGADKFSF